MGIGAWLREHVIGWPCPQCGGAGIYWAFPPTAPLSSLRRKEPYPCGRCDGTGRVFTRPGPGRRPRDTPATSTDAPALRWANKPALITP